MSMPSLDHRGPQLTADEHALVAQIAVFPRWSPVDYAQWAELLPALARTLAPHADLGAAAQHVWFGGQARHWSRSGPLVFIRSTSGDEVMVVSLGNPATLGAKPRAAVATLLATANLRYVPDETAALLQPIATELGRPLVTETDDADYVYDLDALATLSRPGLERHAEDAAWLEAHGRPVVREGRLRDPWVRDRLSVIFDMWCATRPRDEPTPDDVLGERAGLFSLPADRSTDHLRVYVLTTDDAPAAFSLTEPAWNGMWLGVVFKYDRRVRGATAYLRREVARRARGELGNGTLNLAQDAGQLQLRASKLGWQPVTRVEKWRTLPRAN